MEDKEYLEAFSRLIALCLMLFLALMAATHPKQVFEGVQSGIGIQPNPNGQHPSGQNASIASYIHTNPLLNNMALSISGHGLNISIPLSHIAIPCWGIPCVVPGGAANASSAPPPSPPGSNASVNAGQPNAIFPSQNQYVVVFTQLLPHSQYTLTLRASTYPPCFGTGVCPQAVSTGAYPQAPCLGCPTTTITPNFVIAINMSKNVTTGPSGSVVNVTFTV